MRVALGFSCSNRAHCETSFLNCAGISVRPKSFQSHKTIRGAASAFWLGWVPVFLPRNGSAPVALPFSAARIP